MNVKPMKALIGFLVLAGCAAPYQLPPDPVIPPPFNQPPQRDYRVPDTDETASQAFLEQEIERKRQSEPVPDPVPAPPVVDRTVYVDRYVAQGTSDPAGAFPWGTIYGASVGALIGYGSDHEGEGAAIGAGIGFLFDLGRWGRD